jgi:hypothetical protein
MRNASNPMARWSVLFALALAAGCSSTLDGKDFSSGGASPPRSPAPGSSMTGSSTTAPVAPPVISPTPSPTSSPPAGAGAGGAAGTGGAPAPGPTPAPVPPGTTPPPSVTPPVSMPPPPPPTSLDPQAGLLTAGTWDDNLNFDFFKAYGQKIRAQELPGLPAPVVADRMVVLVSRPGGLAVTGARVTLLSGVQEVAHTVTGADGRALFFPGWNGVAAGAALEVVAEGEGVRASAPARAGDALISVPLGAPAGGVGGLDVAIVIDTTGSMGDEIRYLQAELVNVSSAVKTLFPAVGGGGGGGGVGGLVDI